MTSPFKFLDPYGPEDINAFFGRTAETQELYSLVTKNRLTFVYGPSGTGKTSLVRCGLANRFKGVDWLPLFIRRGADINLSLREAVGKALGQDMAYDGELSDAIETLFNRFLRPVYLIFDQFEELFILGEREDDKEREPFYHTIADLVDLELPCRILFIMREDYFGYLDRFEQLIPELYHRKLRVEPMSRENVHKVIVGTCKEYGIAFGEPAKDPDRILDNLLPERSAVQMPFVQVYLHQLYLAAAGQQGNAKIRFDRPVIEQMGPIENVLGQFLEDQERDILRQLAPMQPPENLVRRVLDVFVSDEGTKVPVPFHTDSKDQIRLEGRAAERLALLDERLISACVLALERSRVLRRGEDQLEVAHDTLAALIDRQRSAEQRQLNEIRRRIETGYKEHVDSEGAFFFDKGQLTRIEPFLEQIPIPDAWREFLQASRKEVERRENAEQLRVKRELALAEEKLAAEQVALQTEQQARRRQRRLNQIMAVVAVLALVASVFAFTQYRAADKAAIAAEEARQEAQAKQAEAEKNLQDRIALEIQNLLNDVEAYETAGLIPMAKKVLEDRLQIDSTNETLRSKLAELERK